ncbi:hypothetical protein [Chitinophaga silvatica]|nr:hypothetical protein [Chitinophaga silvatica]
MKSFTSLSILIACIVIYTSTQAQSGRQSRCSVIIDPSYNGKVGIYNSAFKLVKYLKHSESKEEDDCLVFSIKGENDSMFFGTIGYAIAGSKQDGWIKKTKYIGLYSRAYNGDLLVYELPDIKSKKTVIKEYLVDLLPVISCRNGWVKVIIKLDNKTISGWLPPEMQCDNPFTTCN